MKPLLSLVATGLVLAAAPIAAQSLIQAKTVQFKKGEAGTTIKGTLQGDQTIDHQLSAGAGQSMVIKFAPSNDSAYFNLLPPGSSDEAIHIVPSAGHDFAAEPKAGGAYTIRVYLMRSAARRNESTKFTLDVGISGDVKKN